MEISWNFVSPKKWEPWIFREKNRPWQIFCRFIFNTHISLTKNLTFSFLNLCHSERMRQTICLWCVNTMLTGMRCTADILMLHCRQEQPILLQLQVSVHQKNNLTKISNRNFEDLDLHLLNIDGSRR